jgi:radical SAM superfamily enzyme YgiQ (UPF0313 family)
MNLNVYLADLRHDFCGIIANDCMPLGVGYMKAVMDRDLAEVRSRLFVYPERLLDALAQSPPDVLMLSNYCWNERLSQHVARVAKRIRPETLVVMGGPNISMEPERQRAYLGDHSAIDLYVLGEGDFLAAEVVRHFLDSGASIEKMGAREIPSSIYRRPDGTVVRTAAWERHKNVDDIPSPWLTGVLDEFFDGRLAPIIETNRGCPFACTFCSQGASWYTKVNYFGMERLREEIHYIARRVHKHSPLMRTLRIADSNYGMYERDAEISSYLGETQKEYGWPSYIDATTGKNRPDRIIRSIEKVSGAMLFYQAVQSLDEDVLRNVKRTAIKMEAFEQLRVYVRGRGLRSNTDLILGLPGETLASHLQGIRAILDGGMSRITNFQLMMLKGTELEQLESRRMFNFRTGFRILPKNFGIYAGEKVIDIEEIVCATDSLPFEDYLEARRVALVCGFLCLDTYFDEVAAFVEKMGIKRSAWVDAIVARMKVDSAAIRQLLAEFTEETRQELFPTPEACIEFYERDENFEKLLRAEAGDNLIHKYRASASFYLWPQACNCVMEASRALLEHAGVDRDWPGFEAFWKDLHRFVEIRHAWGHDRETILSSSRCHLHHDIPGWLAAGCPQDGSPYLLPEGAEFQFRLSDDSAQALEKAFEMWTDSLSGLTKMIARLQVGTQNREGRAVAQASACGVGA